MKREGRQHGMVVTYPCPMSSEPLNLRRKQRSLNEVATAGLFAKVSSKPTNHSKFTGKCGRSKCYGCHIHPVTKSKDKAKGAQKLRSSSDVVSNYRLITWRVVDSAPGLKLSGFSATAVLNYLDEYADDYDYDYDYNDYDYESETNDHEHVHEPNGNDRGDHDVGFDGFVDYEMRSHDVEIEEIDGCDDSNDGAGDYESETNDHEHGHDRGDHDVGFDGFVDYEMRSHGVEIEEIDGCDDSNDDDVDDDDDRMSFCEVGFVWEPVDGDESWCLVEEI